MAFGRGKRGKKADNDEVTTTEAHSDNSEALPALNTDEVVPERTDFDGKAAQDGLSKAEQRMKRDADLEAKYPHMVSGSIRFVPRGEKVGDTVSKGRVATVKCTDCGAHRDVNLQDVFQVRRCVSCAKAHTQRRLDEKRAARAAARKDKEIEKLDDGLLP
jgi:hypothetical protein